MAEPDLSRVGNIQAEYHPTSHNVKFEGIVHGWGTHPTLILKLYSLFQDQGFSEQRIEYIKRTLYNHISCLTLNPYCGLGFAIHSEDTLNVARWDLNDPRILKTTLYLLNGKNSDEPKLDRKSIEIEGAFCTWELFIAAHEKDAWLRFLASQRTDADKQGYLDDVIQGKLPLKQKKSTARLR